MNLFVLYWNHKGKLSVSKPVGLYIKTYNPKNTHTHPEHHLEMACVLVPRAHFISTRSSPGLEWDRAERFTPVCEGNLAAGGLLVWRTLSRLLNLLCGSLHVAPLSICQGLLFLSSWLPFCPFRSGCWGIDTYCGLSGKGLSDGTKINWLRKINIQMDKMK